MVVHTEGAVDIATIIGAVMAFGLILASMLIGGGVGMFMDVPSLLIVVGGTLGAGLMNFPLSQMLGAVGVAKHAILYKSDDLNERIRLLVEFSSKARREGVLSLESEVEKIDDLVADTLSPAYGYERPPSPDQAANG